MPRSSRPPSPTATWWVKTADDAELEADFVIAATGVLHHPFTPEIPGLDTFGGDVVHTARWDDEIATRDRRIAVIGNGSTGVQIVSALQREAAQITHFVRTPQWVIWAPMGLAQPTLVGKVLRRLPAMNRRLYDGLLQGLAHLDRYRHAAELAATAGPELRALVPAHPNTRSRVTRPTHTGLPALL